MHSKIIAFVCYRLGFRPLARAFERARARALQARWERVRPDLYYHLPPHPRRPR